MNGNLLTTLLSKFPCYNHRNHRPHKPPSKNGKQDKPNSDLCMRNTRPAKSYPSNKLNGKIQTTA